MKRLLIAALLIAALLFLLRLGLTLLTTNVTPQNRSFRPQIEVAPSAQQVETGLYANNLYDLDIASNTYYLDAYIWFKWKGKINPVENLELVNAVEEWGLTQTTLQEETQTLADGRQYQIIHVEGRFVHPFELARFPLDRQKLGITLENSLYTADKLAYLPDKQQSGFSETLAVPGWKITGFEVQSLLHDYKTNFGEPLPPSGKTTYSALRYELSTERPISYFAWKLLLPLVIVLVSGWGAFLLNPNYPDSRIALPVTALLTIVFLQQTYSASIPEVGYLVLLDKIYALAYVLIIFAILETIITADWAKSTEPNSHARIAKLDRQSLVAQSLLLILGVTALIFW